VGFSRPRLPGWLVWEPLYATAPARAESISECRAAHSGGGPGHFGPLSCPVDVNDAFGDLGQQFRRVESPERSLGDQQRLPDDGRGVLHLLVSLRRCGAESHGLKRRLDRVRSAQVFPAAPRRAMALTLGTGLSIVPSR
jgi:hypothetical protein